VRPPVLGVVEPWPLTFQILAITLRTPRAGVVTTTGRGLLLYSHYRYSAAGHGALLGTPYTPCFSTCIAKEGSIRGTSDGGSLGPGKIIN